MHVMQSPYAASSLAQAADPVFAGLGIGYDFS
jgi:hypothetical protein